ncbi:MAG: hypothetical protein H5U39_08950 [Deferribacterales bacterium]|nr:hypothetical protein [Deferribacterales bacterium]
MIECINDFFPNDITFVKPNGGLFIWLGFSNDIDTNSILKASSKKYKVSYVPGDIFFLNPTEGKNFIRLNYSSNDEFTIEQGMKRLGMVFKDHINGLAFF